MVLAEMGSKIAIALRKMTSATVVDSTVMNEMLAEICKALLQADVNVAQVKKMRESMRGVQVGGVDEEVRSSELL